MPRRAAHGFILPLAVLLVVMLTISGTAFMQHDYLERRMAMHDVDNQSAFYLANAGIERAREVLKIDTSASPTWTPVLTSLPNDPNRANNPLCPLDAAWRCVTLPFGDPVLPPDIPFGETFTDGQYQVRAFNDSAPGERGTIDMNGLLTIRALGNIRGEQKLLEATVRAVSSDRLVNCNELVQPSSDCPDGAAFILTELDGRAPASVPVSAMPSLPPIVAFGDACPPSLLPVPPDPNRTCCNPDNYYCHRDNFPLSWGYQQFLGPGTVTREHIDGVEGSPKVIISGGGVDIRDPTQMQAILVARLGVSLDRGPGGAGTIAIQAPRPYPAVIAEGAVAVEGAVTVEGTIYSKGGVRLRGPTVPIAPGLRITGVVYGLGLGGERVTAQAMVTITDGGDLNAYAVMPGFTYPNGSLTNAVVPGTWRELQ